MVFCFLDLLYAGGFPKHTSRLLRCHITSLCLQGFVNIVVFFFLLVDQ